MQIMNETIKLRKDNERPKKSWIIRLTDTESMIHEILYAKRNDHILA